MKDIQIDWIVMAAFPLTIMLVFIVHELGHYIIARLHGVRADKFIIGCGKEIWGRTDKCGTRWSIRMFPICGLIHLAGKTSQVPEKEKFNNKSIRQRASIVIAGPLINIAFAFILFFGVFTIMGQASVPPYITGIEVNNNADKAGIKIGDRVLKIEGKQVRRYEDVGKITRHITDVPLSITLQRNGEIIETTVISSEFKYTDIEGFERSHGRIGVRAMHRPLSLKSVASVNGIDTKENEDKARELILANMDREIIIGTESVDGEVHDYIVNIRAALNYDFNNSDSRDYKRIYTGEVDSNFYLRRNIIEGSIEATKEISRLISGIFHSIREPWHIDGRLITSETQPSSRDGAWKVRIYRIIYFMAFVSICVGLINLLPVPGFDGSVLILLLAEATKGPGWVTKNHYKILIGSLGVVYGSVALSHLVV